MTYGRAAPLPSFSISSSLDESKAALRLNAVVGLHPPSSLAGLGGESSTSYTLGDLGGESSTVYELGVPLGTLGRAATGDLLLLLLSRDLLLSSSPGWASYSVGIRFSGSCTGLMCTSSARTSRRIGLYVHVLGIDTDVVHGVDPCSITTSSRSFPPFDTASTLGVLHSPFLSIPIFFVIVRFVTIVRVVVPTEGATGHVQLGEAGLQDPEGSSYHRQDRDAQDHCLHP